MTDLPGLQGYDPKPVNEGFDIIKANGLECKVNYCRIEVYSGDKQEFFGKEFLSYELEVVGGVAEHVGRKFWKRYAIDDESQVKKMADMFFTVGITFKTKEELEAKLEEFCAKVLIVRAWGWKPDGKDESVQIHLVKGEKKDSQAGASEPSF